VAEVKAKAERWETKFKSALVEHAVTDAAKKHGASADQLRAILKDIKVVEGTDGQFTPMVSLQGESGVVELDEAVRRMKGLPQLYGNLFRSAAVSGVGSSSNPAGAQPGTTNTLTPQQAAKLPASEYFRVRSQQRNRMPWAGR
jgi:hypothetical protein